MSTPYELKNSVRSRRETRGWSQAELAERSGLSRTAISAIEGERLTPSVAAALALAKVFECSVEELFAGGRERGIDWAWAPARSPARYWAAECGGVTRLYPAESSSLGSPAHDGLAQEKGAAGGKSLAQAGDTLVVAGCDPAAGLLAAALARRAGVRMIVVPRSSQAALDLLGQGVVHAAGVHLAAAGRAHGNAQVVRAQLGSGYQLLRVARWQAGLTITPTAGVNSIQSAVRARRLSWVGREAGSGARQCLDELLEGRRAPERIAYDHRGVAEAVRCGWADVGVCLRLVSEEARLDFLPVREESYDLCVASHMTDDPRIVALAAALRGRDYRRRLGELPGYDAARTGDLETVG
ncbi:MAG: helix-turn-helix domain-containing protein [Pirellulales bacterium]|nr:helix-turn-helix domain-containing protein [Pirellulales bacterium]